MFMPEGVDAKRWCLLHDCKNRHKLLHLYLGIYLLPISAEGWDEVHREHQSSTWRAYYYLSIPSIHRLALRLSSFCIHPSMRPMANK